MAKIFSRKRLIIPKLKRRGKKIVFLNRSEDIEKSKFLTNGNGNGKDNNFGKIRNKKLIKVSLIIIIAICIANKLIKTIEPTMDILCTDMAKSIATKISNEQATEVMRKL